MKSVEFSHNKLEKLLKIVVQYLIKERTYAESIHLSHQIDGDYWICYLYFYDRKGTV